MPNDRGYIVDLVTGRDIGLRYYDPPTKSVAAEWTKTSIPLRSEPHHNYMGTGAPSIPISCTICASATQDDERTPDDVIDDVNFLESLQYPDYGGPAAQGRKVVRPPHLVGIYLTGVLDERGYIEGVNTEWLDITDIQGKQLIAKVSFTFIVISELTYRQAPSYEQILYRRYLK